MKACVDVGGTKVAVSLVADGQQTLQHRRTEPTAKSGPPDALARQLIRMVEAACADASIDPNRLGGIGVSSCGPFVMQSGSIALASPNICGGLAGNPAGLPNDWATAPLQAPLAARFAAVRVANDGVAALEAERRWGALQGLDHCAYVTWSTGIGTGLCVDGRVLLGKNGNAGHAGHMMVGDDDPEAVCGCGNRGDVEALIAGIAIGRRFAAQGYADAPALLAAARAGDGAAAEIVDALCRTLGRTLYNLIVTLDLQRIALGGSVFWHHRDNLLPRLQSHIDGKLPALTAGCNLVPAGLGERVGDYAALALLTP